MNTLRYGLGDFATREVFFAAKSWQILGSQAEPEPGKRPQAFRKKEKRGKGRKPVALKALNGSSKAGLGHSLSLLTYYLAYRP